MMWKNESLRYSGHILDILILGIVVWFNISCNKYINWDCWILLVLSHHRAARLTHVRTISFHHAEEKSLISSIISGNGLDRCFHLFMIVRQNVQKLSQPFWMRINFLVYKLFHCLSVKMFQCLGSSGRKNNCFWNFFSSGYIQ